MPFGPGKYDDLATQARTKARADGVILIVINGKHGAGFSVQTTPAVLLELPTMLRGVADDIEASLKRGTI